MKQTKEVKAILKEIDRRIIVQQVERDSLTWDNPQYRTFVDKEDELNRLRNWITNTKKS